MGMLACSYSYLLVLNVTHVTVTDLIVKFLFKILCNLWPIGKCVSTSLRKLRAVLVLTFLLNGGLNQMMLRGLFLRGCCATCGMYSMLVAEVAICPSAFTTCKFTSKTLWSSFLVLSAKRADLSLYRDDSLAIIKNRFKVFMQRNFTSTFFDLSVEIT